MGLLEKKNDILVAIFNIANRKFQTNQLFKLFTTIHHW